MAEEPADLLAVLKNSATTDRDALAEVFSLYQDRLKRMVRLRMDRRLQGRIDPSDVLQEVFLEASKRAVEYAADPKIPFFLWLHLLARQRLLIIHRRYFDAKMRDASLEVSLNTGPMPQASSGSLAAHLLGKLTSPSQAMIRAELQLQLQQALNSMDSLDREVLTLRHFEEMSNGETAIVLNLSKSAASNRYIRALKRLKDILTGIHGLEQL